MTWLSFAAHTLQLLAVAAWIGAMTFFSLMAERYNSVDHRMRDGELLFIDYGAAEFQTYAADLCRTLPVSGTFTPLIVSAEMFE